MWDRASSIRSTSGLSRGEPLHLHRFPAVAPRLGPEPLGRLLRLRHPKVVSERLGHASVAITLDTYSHGIAALQEDAAAKVAALIAE
jgi:integrase